MNTMKTKRDMSFEIQHAVKSLGVSYREIAMAANVGASTISCAARHGYKVNRSTHLAIAQGIQSLMPTHAARCITTPVTDEYTPTATLAANLEKQVEQLRETINGSGLVDDQLESAHSREKAEPQKALAARISEVQNLAADVAYEREKGLDTLNQLLRAEDMLKDERVKNETQAESIGQCFDEIERLKRLVALRTQDLAVYQKALEDADNRADDAERDLTVQRAWTWLFVLLAFVAAVVGVVK